MLSELLPTDIYVFGSYWFIRGFHLSSLSWYHIAKASECICVLGDCEDRAALAGQPKPALQVFVMSLAFERRTSPTTKACQNPQGKSGLSSLQKVGHVPGEVWARWPFVLPALERKPDKNVLST